MLLLSTVQFPMQSIGQGLVLLHAYSSRAEGGKQVKQHSMSLAVAAD
jgi:hypothetical protein